LYAVISEPLDIQVDFINSNGSLQTLMHIRRGRDFLLDIFFT